ncbi:MAG: O-antigen ligase family protein, partial [Parcubacteria group bacterium]|nr:O-antigen ligase family protein [Parcubacteria group bacterium]
GLFFVYGIYTRGIKKIITPTIGVSIFIVFIFISSIFISGATRYREHFFGVFDARIDTGAYRKIWWKHSTDIIKHAPLFGYGLETERAQFVRYYQPTDALYETINTHPDRAHNELLNYLIIAGWPGLIGFLFFFGSLVFYSFRAARQGDETEKNIGLISFLSLAGYFVYLQFSFSTIIDLIFLWGIAGMVIKILPRACRANSFFDFFIFKRVSEMKLPFHFRANEENIGLLSSIFKKIATLFSHPKLNIRNHAIRYLAIVFIASAGLFIIFEINLRPLIADYYFARLMLFTPAFPDKLRLYEKVFRWNGGERYYRDQYALTLLGNLEQYATNEHKSAIARIVEESYETMKVNKLPMWSALRYAEAKTLRGYFENNEDLFREAEKIFSSRANESPAMPIIYSEWCRLYILWNRYGDAEQLCKKAFSLYPLDQFKTTDRRRQNAMAYEIGLTLSRLAIIYGYDGRNREAINAYQKILLYLPFNQNTYKRLLELYEEIGDTENAKQIKQKGSAVWPDEQSFR